MIRRAFLVSVLMILALQPIYLLALMALDTLAPAESRAAHIATAFKKASVDKWGYWDTECVALSIGLEPGASPLRNAVDAPRLIKPHTALLCEELYRAAVGQPDIHWSPYPRYWHGYRVVIDPLTAWLSIPTARYLMLLLLVAALGFFALESRLLIGVPATLALLIPTVVMAEMWSIWYIMAHAVSTIVIFAGAAWFARMLRNGASPGELIVSAAVLGSVFNYVDFLTNPPWQPMLLAFFMLARKDHSPFDCALMLAAWAGGYALTWASKWFIAAALSPDGLAVLRDIADVVRYRIDGDYLQLVNHHLLAPSFKVLSFVFWHRPWAFALAILMPALVLVHHKHVEIRRFMLLALPALIPFLWYEIMSNHTQLHTSVAYRPVGSSVGILLAAWILASSGRLASAPVPSAPATPSQP
jgi:hypothetical protein